MCEAGTKFMEMFGNEPNEEAQKKAIEQIEKMFNDESMDNKHFQIALEEGLGIMFMTTNAHISGKMKKMENCDELKQLLVQDPCEEAKLKVKKVDKMNKIVGKMDKIDIGESSKMRKRVSKH
ncbi:hypothetical protein niasHT_009091 [Heterodera trifolii]|uniref:Uncharacterized protein n=1 Tax=Heterodera trifolii TaxID=157864 RepID=A0ABD2M7U0_9BILA